MPSGTVSKQQFLWMSLPWRIIPVSNSEEPPFISHGVRPFGRGTTPVRGLTITMLTTYKSWDDPPSMMDIPAKHSRRSCDVRLGWSIPLTVPMMAIVTYRNKCRFGSGFPTTNVSVRGVLLIDFVSSQGMTQPFTLFSVGDEGNIRKPLLKWKLHVGDEGFTFDLSQGLEIKL